MTNITPIQEQLDLIASLRDRAREDLLTRDNLNLHLDRLEAATRQLAEIVHNGGPLKPRAGERREDAVKLVAETFDCIQHTVRKGSPGDRNGPTAREAAIWLRLNVEKRDRARIGREFGLAPAGLEQLAQAAERRIARDPSFRGVILALKRILDDDSGETPPSDSNVFFLNPEAKKEARHYGH